MRRRKLGYTGLVVWCALAILFARFGLKFIIISAFVWVVSCILLPLLLTIFKEINRTVARKRRMSQSTYTFKEEEGGSSYDKRGERTSGYSADSDQEEKGESKDLDWCYTLLGVATTSPLEDIHKAYRRKAKLHHPDRKGDVDAMKALNLAWELLEKEKRT